MTDDGGCGRVSLAGLTEYAAGELPADRAAALEEHLFSCAACGALAAEFEALTGAIRAASVGATFGGFTTDAVLNRLARDGVRLRMFALAPGAIVPCAVWEHDELLVLRLRADVEAASDVTLVQRAEGAELVRATTQVASPHGELLFATPAAWLRRLPAVDVDVVLTASAPGGGREVARYTLSHGGALQRRADGLDLQEP